MGAREEREYIIEFDVATGSALAKPQGRAIVTAGAMAARHPTVEGDRVLPGRRWDLSCLDAEPAKSSGHEQLRLQRLNIGGA